MYRLIRAAALRELESAAHAGVLAAREAHFATREAEIYRSDLERATAQVECLKTELRRVGADLDAAHRLLRTEPSGDIPNTPFLTGDSHE